MLKRSAMDCCVLIIPCSLPSLTPLVDFAALVLCCRQGLVGFVNLMCSHPRAVAEHRSLVLACLSDDDVTIRTRALELLSGEGSYFVVSPQIRGPVEMNREEVRVLLHRRRRGGVQKPSSGFEEDSCCEFLRLSLEVGQPCFGYLG